jgi:hypothetical protein
MKYGVDRARGELRRTDELVAKAVADLILPAWHRTLHYHGGGAVRNRDICLPRAWQRSLGAAANIRRWARFHSQQGPSDTLRVSYAVQGALPLIMIGCADKQAANTGENAGSPRRSLCPAHTGFGGRRYLAADG